MDHPNHHSLFGLGLPGYIYIFIDTYFSEVFNTASPVAHGKQLILFFTQIPGVKKKISPNPCHKFTLSELVV